MGHRDTVFPDGEAARRPFTVDGDTAYGPGVADMKAGLVMNAFVLAAFKRFGGSPYPLTGLYTSDEEIASPSSRPVIANEARIDRAAFNAPPGREPCQVVASLHGLHVIHVPVTGVDTHSSDRNTHGTTNTQ